MSLTSTSISELTKVRDNLIAMAKGLEARVALALSDIDVSWAKDELGAVQEKLAEIETDLGLKKPEPAPEVPEEPVTK